MTPDEIKAGLTRVLERYYMRDEDTAAILEALARLGQEPPASQAQEIETLKQEERMADTDALLDELIEYHAHYWDSAACQPEPDEIEKHEQWSQACADARSRLTSLSAENVRLREERDDARRLGQEPPASRVQQTIAGLEQLLSALEIYAESTRPLGGLRMEARELKVWVANALTCLRQRLGQPSEDRARRMLLNISTHLTEMLTPAQLDALGAGAGTELDMAVLRIVDALAERLGVEQRRERPGR